MAWSQNYQINSPTKKNPNLPNQNCPTTQINPYQQTILKNQPRLTQHHHQNTQHHQPYPNNFNEMKTPVSQYHSQHPIRKAVIFLGSNRSKHLFPVYRDSQIGIQGEFQRKVHHSSHDDDKMTTTTQLGLAVSQTCQDLYQVLVNQGHGGWEEGQHGSFTQRYTYQEHQDRSQTNYQSPPE